MEDRDGYACSVMSYAMSVKLSNITEITERGNGWELLRIPSRRLWFGAGTGDTSGPCCCGFLSWLGVARALGLLLLVRPIIQTVFSTLTYHVTRRYCCLLGLTELRPQRDAKRQGQAPVVQLALVFGR